MPIMAKYFSSCGRCRFYFLFLFKFCENNFSSFFTLRSLSPFWVTEKGRWGGIEGIGKPKSKWKTWWKNCVTALNCINFFHVVWSVRPSVCPTNHPLVVHYYLFCSCPDDVMRCETMLCEHFVRPGSFFLKASSGYWLTWTRSRVTIHTNVCV